MRKLIIGAILSVAFVCGIFVYTSWEQRRFADSLPTSPVVEKIVDIHIHPHPHVESGTATDASAVGVDSDPGAKENTVSTSTEHKSEEDTTPVDAESQTEAASQSSAAWLTDDEHDHEHPSTQDPFAKKTTPIEDMDPDEFADMILVGLLEKFGDIPEVHTFMAVKRKLLKNEETSLEERIDFMIAQYHLWPDPRTKKSLEAILEGRADESLRK